MALDGELTTSSLLIAAVTAASGVAGAFINKWFSKKKHEVDVATKIREELRGDIELLKKENEARKRETQKVSEELDRWKRKYFRLEREYNVLVGNYKLMRAQLEMLKGRMKQEGIDFVELDLMPVREIKELEDEDEDGE